MTLGLFLLHLMGVHTSTFLDAVYMLVLGLGLGSVMQVLVIIVQNGVPHSELGVATSGATFFRSIGGSFGTAIFGAIFSNVLIGNLASHLHGIHLPAGFSAADATPALLGKLPAVVHAGFVAGYAESIQTVFLVAVPIACLAFLATWFIPQVELKQWPEPNAEAGAPEAAMAVPGATVSAEVLDQPGPTGTRPRPGPRCPRNPWIPRTPPPTPDRPIPEGPGAPSARPGAPSPTAAPARASPSAGAPSTLLAPGREVRPSSWTPRAPGHAEPGWPDAARARDVRVTLAGDALDDLRERLRRTRLPAADGDGWARGVPRSWLAALLADWETFDIAAFQARLDRLTHREAPWTASGSTWCTRPGRARTRCRCC